MWHNSVSCSQRPCFIVNQYRYYNIYFFQYNTSTDIYEENEQHFDRTWIFRLGKRLFGVKTKLYAYLFTTIINTKFLINIRISNENVLYMLNVCLCLFVYHSCTTKICMPLWFESHWSAFSELLTNFHPVNSISTRSHLCFPFVWHLYICIWTIFDIDWENIGIFNRKPFLVWYFTSFDLPA